MGGIDQYRHSSRKRVNVKICVAFTKYYSDAEFHATVIEFEEKKKIDKMGKLFVMMWYFSAHLAYGLVLTCIVL